MSGLLLPKRTIAAMKAKKDAAAAESIQKGIYNQLESDEFATPKVCQDQLDQLEAWIEFRRQTEPGYRLPQPVGWRISVLMLTVPSETDGGLVLVDEHREARSVASPQGIVLAVGSRAYCDPSRFGNALEPWCKVGDRIGFTKYDAGLFRLGSGQIIGFLTDTQPVSFLEEGWKVPT